MSFATSNFLQRAATNRIAGIKKIHLYGNNAAISTSNETVWSPSGTYAQLTAAVAFEVLGGAADTAAGTGARTVEMDLVDGNYVETTVQATLNGATAVILAGTYLACNDIRILTAGSGLVNSGAITVRVSAAGATKGHMAAGTGYNTGFVYTVPAGCIALLTSASFSVTGCTGEPSLRMFTRDSAGLFRQWGQVDAGFSAAGLSNAQGKLDVGNGYVIQEKTLLEAQILSVGGAAGAATALGELFVFDTRNCEVI